MCVAQSRVSRAEESMEESRGTMLLFPWLRLALLLGTPSAASMLNVPFSASLASDSVHTDFAATPMAGRLSVYIVSLGATRADDGSCATTETCPYISVADGGTGTAIYHLDTLCNMGLVHPDVSCSRIYISM